MILTCPSCGTRYVVKDGAIPPAGRTVRCAQCKHSWHQDPEDQPVADGDGVNDAGSVEENAGAEGQPFAVEPQSSHADMPGDPAYPDAGAGESFSEPAATPSASLLAEEETAASMSAEAAAAPEPYPEASVPVEEPAYAAEAEPGRTAHPLRAARMEADDLYSPFAAEDEDDAPRSRWPLIAGIVIVLIALVAAGVYFLAPTELKGRLGLAQGDASTRLTVQIQQHGRTQLASGNQLFEVSGIVRNETDETLPVPPLNAQLRSLEQQVVYRWTIPISPQQLAPGSTASFNSANLDVPAAAACLEVYFGQQLRVPRCSDKQAVGA